MSSPETCISGQFTFSWRRKYGPFKLSYICHISYNLWIFWSIDVSLSPTKNILSETTFPTFTLSLWENLLAYIISTIIMLINIDSFRTSHDKASDDECKHKTRWFFWVPSTRTCIQIWSSTNMKWANCAFHLNIHRQNYVPLVVSKYNCIFSLHIKGPKFLQLALKHQLYTASHTSV